MKRSVLFAAAAGAVATAVATVGSASTLGSVKAPTLSEGSVVLRGCSGATPAGATFAFGLTSSGADGGPAALRIQSVTLKDLGPDCEGSYLHVTLTGNPAGDPSEPSAPLYDTAGSFASSGLNAGNNCDFTSLGAGHDEAGGVSNVVTNGSATVLLCGTGARGPLPAVANITGVTVLVSDDPMPAQATASNIAFGSIGSPGAAPNGNVPFSLSLEAGGSPARGSFTFRRADGSFTVDVGCYSETGNRAGFSGPITSATGLFASRVGQTAYAAVEDSRSGSPDLVQVDIDPRYAGDCSPTVFPYSVTSGDVVVQ